MTVTTVHCPRRTPGGDHVTHEAALEEDGTLRFSCRRWTFEVGPDGLERLGTPAWVTVARKVRPALSYCLNCPSEVHGTAKDANGRVEFVCYRCGTVGRYLELARDDWEPDREAWLMSEASDEIAEARFGGRFTVAQLDAWSSEVDEVERRLEELPGSPLPCGPQPEAAVVPLRPALPAPCPPPRRPRRRREPEPTVAPPTIPPPEAERFDDLFDPPATAATAHRWPELAGEPVRSVMPEPTVEPPENRPSLHLLPANEDLDDSPGFAAVIRRTADRVARALEGRG